MKKFSRSKLAVAVGTILLPCADMALAAVPTVTLSRVTSTSYTEIGTDVKFKIDATDSDSDLKSIHFCRKVGASIDNDDVCQVVVSNINSAGTSRTENVTKNFGPASVNGTKAVYYAYAVDQAGSQSTAAVNEEIFWKADVVVSDGNIGTLQSKIDLASNGLLGNSASIFVTGIYNGTSTTPGIQITGKQFITLAGSDNARIVGLNTSNDVVSINNSKGIKVLGFTIGNNVPGSETPWSLIKGKYGIVVAGGPTTSTTIPTGPSEANVIASNKVRLTSSSGIRVDGASYVEVQNNVVEKTNAGQAYMYYTDAERSEVTDTNWLIKDFFVDAADGLRKMHYRTDRNDTTASKVNVANDCIQAFNRESTGDSSNDKLFRPTQEMLSISKVKTGTNSYRKSSFVNVVGNEVFNGPWTINNVCVIGKEGIDLKSGSSNSNAEFNYVHDLKKLGIYVDAYQDLQENNIINANVVHNTKHGIALSAEDESGTVPAGVKLLINVLISNNRVYENDQDGIIITDFGHALIRDRIKILNNTVVSNKRHGINIGSDNVDNVFIVNNLVSNNLDKQIVRDGLVGPDQYSSTTNLVWKANSGTACTDNLTSFGNAIGTNVICAAPKLYAIDYSLQKGSPAEDTAFEGVVKVEAGTTSETSITVSTEVTKDATGAERPLNDGWGYDIGAMEYFP